MSQLKRPATQLLAGLYKRLIGNSHLGPVGESAEHFVRRRRPARAAADLPLRAVHVVPNRLRADHSCDCAAGRLSRPLRELLPQFVTAFFD
jgi:hypothetical protein